MDAVDELLSDRKEKKALREMEADEWRKRRKEADDAERRKEQNEDNWG